MTRSAAIPPALLAGGPAVIAFLVYLATLPPTITGEDSAELIAAAWCLGIPHPPAYPLYIDLAYLFTWIPIGEPAWRVNLLSAALGALTTGLAALLSFRLTGSRAGACLAALLLAFSREFWEQSVIAEVYTLNSALLAGALLLLWHWSHSGQSRYFYGLALVYGLGLANHPTMMLIAPVFLVAALGLDPTRPRSLTRYLKGGALAGVTALFFYGQVFWRAKMNPPVDWGNPDSPARWWSVIRREQYAFMMTEHPRNAGRFVHQLSDALGTWIDQWGILIAAAVALGALLLSWRKPIWGAFLIAIGLVTVLGAIAMQNPSPDREWRWVMTVFYIPLYMVIAIGAAALWSALEDRIKRPGLLAAVGAVALLFVLVRNWNHNDKSGYYWVEDFAMNILDQLPEDAIFIPESDHEAFPMLYFQHVKKLRPDLVLGRKYGYLENNFVPGMAEQFAAYGPAPRRRHEPEMIAWAVANAERRIFATKPIDLSDFGGYRFVQHGLLYEALPDTTPDTENDWPDYQWRNGLDGPTRGDYTADLIRYQVYLAQARLAFAANSEDEALRLVTIAMDAYGPDPRTMNQAAILCAQNKAYDEARQYFETAHNLDPENEAIRNNMEKLRIRSAP